MLFFKPLAGIIIVLALVLTQGCAFTRGNYRRADFKTEAVAAIKKGTTTMAEVRLH